MNARPPSLYSGFDLEIGQRVLFFFMVGIIALIFLSFGVGATALLVAAACAAMGYEWFHLTTGGDSFDEPILGIALAAAALPPFMAFAVGPLGGVVVSLLAVGFLLFMGPRHEDRLHLTAPGLLLIGIAGVCFVWLRDDPSHGLALTAWLVLVVAATEAGSGFIKQYMANNENSAEGAEDSTLTQLAFSLMCGIVAGVIVTAFYREGSVFWAIIASLFVAVVVLLAGFATDYLKRKSGTGPSGTLFFGKGPVIENFDGLVCASIFAAFLMMVGGAMFSW